ncbi:hypothetical protein CIPAW_12G006100 [Carya illinoinensis]|uniref:No apical meristem-associated C-terminal domain-containing protein n=1 Tax=Carya illinoinensis TaxID=32201 RepID=A0A8T1NTT7_CARIL|nr:hypothetical protein CIPAW_12G006100 [Carya illinoinensis]
MDSQDPRHMYFTNLLSQDPQLNLTYGGQSGNSLMTVDDSPPLPHNDPIGVRKSIRGANFTPEEDKLLAFTRLNCSLDQFKETINDWTIKSLIHWWSVIQKATNKFCTKLTQVEGLNQSGMIDFLFTCKFDKAKVMYQSLDKCFFQFEHCWHLLKDQPKWIWHSTKEDLKRRKMMSTSLIPTQCSGAMVDSVFDLETDNVIDNDVTELDRPMGRKVEKGKRKAQGRQAEENFVLRKMKYTLLEESQYDKEKEGKKMCLKDERLRLEAKKMENDRENELNKIRQEGERLMLEAEKLELAKKEADQRFMMMDLSAMPSMQRLYFQQLQWKIIARRNAAADLD